MALVRNKPTPEGQALGVELARLTENAKTAVKAVFPDHAEPCQSCAFRAGTLPNGCPETVMDALKCVVTGEPFYCHQGFDVDGKPTKLCAGWVIAMSSMNIPPALDAIVEPWPLDRGEI